MTARRFTCAINFALDTATPAQYAGRYANGTTVTLKEGTLSVSLGGGASGRLAPV